MLHQLTRLAVRRAIERGAALDVIGHHEAIERLDQAARRTSEPAPCMDADALDRPVVVGSGPNPARLYSISLAAHLWMEDADRQGWFSRDPLLANLSVAWALAHARSPLAMRGIESGRDARRAVQRWAASLTCGLDDLIEAARRIVAPSGSGEPPATTPPESGEPAADAPPLGHGLVMMACARLAREFGQPADFWLFAPYASVRAALAVIEAESDAADPGAGVRAGRAARDPRSPAVLAFVAWRKASDAFLKSVCPPDPEEPADE